MFFNNSNSYRVFNKIIYSKANSINTYISFYSNSI